MANRKARAPGQLRKHKLPGGQEITATYKDCRLEKYERSTVSRNRFVTERFSYEYFKDTDNKGRIQYVTHSRHSRHAQAAPDAPLAEEKLRRAAYVYYGKSEPHGNLGDLKTVTHEAWDMASEGWKHRPLAVHYYRYHKSANSTYCQGLLRFVVGPETFALLHNIGVDPLEASDSWIASYADMEIDYYDSSDSFLARRVKSISLYGRGRTHTFEYHKGPNLEADVETTGEYELWHSTTVENRPDGSKRTAVCNFAGQTTRLDLIDPAQNRRWVQCWQYEPQHGGLVAKVDASAVNIGSPFQDQRSGVPAIRVDAGKIHRFTYYQPSTRKAFLEHVFVQEGLNGKPIPLKTFNYFPLDLKYDLLAVKSETTYGVANYIPPPQPSRLERVAFDAATIASTQLNSIVGYNYHFEASGHVTTRETVLPSVSQSHFPAAEKYDPRTTANTVVEQFDEFGNAVSVRDVRNVTTTTEIETVTGAPVKETVVTVEPAGGSQTLVYDYKSDRFGRVTEVLGPSHLAVLPGTNQERVVRAATWYLYKEFSGEVWTSQGYLADSGRVLVNPVLIDRFDRAGRTTDSIAAVRTSTIGPPQVGESSDALTWVRWVQKIHDVHRTTVKTRVYEDIPTGRYNETVITSDVARRERLVLHGGTGRYLTRFDTRGLTTVVQSGNGNSIQSVMEMYYDGDQPDSHTNHQNSGNGNLTKVVRRGAGQVRTTTIQYDFRDRQDSIVESDGGSLSYSYTNQNQVDRMVRVQGGMPLARRAQLVDRRGRVVETQLNGFTPTGAPLDRLYQLVLYDSADQIRAMEPHGRVNGQRPIVRFQYDGMGRETRRESGCEDVASHQFSSYWEVATQNNSVGDPILVTSRGRVPDAFLPAGFSAGVLSGPSAGPQIPSRASSVGTWYDPLGRRLATADFGDTPPGLIRPALALLPAGIPVTAFEYDATGELSQIRDPLGSTTLRRFDHAGRLRAIARNLPRSLWHVLEGNQVSLNAMGWVADDVSVVQHSYAANNRVSATRLLNNTTGTQTTQLFYESELAPDLVSDVIDPEGRLLQNRYNTLGEVERITDQNGITHVYEYDKMGRVIHDRVVEPISQHTDKWVLHIEYKYDAHGRLQQVISYDQPYGGNVVNDVLRRYGSFNELVVEVQRHRGEESADWASAQLHGEADRLPLDKPGMYNRLAYYYDYPIEASPKHRNLMRLRAQHYPSGRFVKAEYADDRSQALGRVSTLVTDFVSNFVPSLGFTTPGPVAYQYWGANEVHEVALVNKKSFLQNRLVSVNSSLTVGSNPFASLDALGRRSVVEWNRRLATWSDGRVLQSSAKVGLSHRYDLSDRLIDERNRLQTTVNDHALLYDRLDRVGKHERGRLIAPATISPGTTRLHQRWSLDQAANWRALQRSDLDAGQQLTQQRAHSRSNHILSIQRTAGLVWASPIHDAEGNMTSVPSPKVPQALLGCKYDAWNRLTEVKDPVTGALNRYEYDGLGRRTMAYSIPSGQLRHFYYDQAGRVVTEYVTQGGQFNLDREYIWDANTPGRLACRIRQTPQGEERLYPLYDGQGNVVAVVDGDGEVQERYRYDVQGNVEYLDGGFVLKPVQDTSVAWQHLFGGLRLDVETGLYFGGGYYHAGLGRLLPSGAISVFSEAYLNSRAAGFPFGTPRPPGASAFARNFEPILQWISEQPKWVKVGIGIAGYLVAAGVIAAQATSPTILLSLAGAAYGGLGGAVEASLSGGDYADVIMVSGLGAAFGAICPIGAIGAFAGGSGRLHQKTLLEKDL